MASGRHARALFDAACRDADAPSQMMEPARFPEEIFGFHAQQAAEKFFKAWLTARNAPYPKTHDLRFLYRRIATLGQPVDRYRKLIALSAFAVQFRYESLCGSAPPMDRGRIEELVNDLRELVGKQLQAPES